MTTIRKKLALASCALLSQQADASAYENDWEVDTSYLSYQEADDRITVSKFIGDIKGKVSDSDAINVKFVHDTISGASPTGAVRSDQESVTFTSASGGTGFRTGDQGSTAALVEDTRVSVGLDWSHSWNRLTTTRYGATISSENDYDSVGASTKLERETKNRLTTYSTGLSFTNDSIFRSGTSDTPKSLASVAEAESLGKGERNSWEAIAGLSRIINRRTLAQFNLSYATSQGYHSDPYKVISALDSDGNIVDTLHENRPGDRTRIGLYSKLAHQLSGSENTIHTSYRLYQDDWNIRSHTFDLKYRNPFQYGQYVEPHIRFYRQTAAEFYHHHLTVDDSVDVALPESGYASADYRLDQFWSYSAGLSYGKSLGNFGSLRLRGEYMEQHFLESEFSENSAVILQASYKHEF